MPHDPGLRRKVRALLPDLTRDLISLIAVPSVSVRGYPSSSHEPLLRAHDAVVHLLREAGLTTESIELPDTAPAVFAEIPAPAGAPTVLLYSHYDVVGAGDESLWTTAPFEPVITEDAVIGRGAADSKSNVIAIIGAIRAWGGRPPVGVKVVLDGMEEVGGGAFTTYPLDAPDRFAADVVIVADLGNVRPGIPTLSVALRGMANVEVEVRTLASAKHSGSFGGAAPEQFRELAEVPPGVPLIGTRTLGSRVWSGPAITVIGIDVPSVEHALNAVSPYARARLNVRVHPRQDPREAQEAVVRHLRAVRPFGIELTVHAQETGEGYEAALSDASYEAAEAAWAQAWERPTVTAGVGGSIPLVASLHAAAPGAEILLGGAADGYANIHGPNERVLLDELERTTLAIADLFGRLAGGTGASA